MDEPGELRGWLQKAFDYTVTLPAKKAPARRSRGEEARGEEASGEEVSGEEVSGEEEEVTWRG